MLKNQAPFRLPFLLESKSREIGLSLTYDIFPQLQGKTRPRLSCVVEYAFYLLHPLILLNDRDVDIL
jgi:hypothetical protein